ncbi:hypothetical protein C8R44DRAFT_872306 [Mycena epipterygia]|nr:hypothetical protein C8R44DRAFT_872306 [Mycena epipterygia]
MQKDGELVIKSENKFSTEHDTCRDTHTSFGVVNNYEVIDFHLVWTKTTTILSAECILTQVKGPDANLCPSWAFKNHQAVNHSPPPFTPLFAFRENGAWCPLTKDHFLRSTSAAHAAAGLETIFGHSYRISGLVELLLAGGEPEILPSRITAAWASRYRQFATTHGLPIETTSLDFDSDTN